MMEKRFPRSAGRLVLAFLPALACSILAVVICTMAPAGALWLGAAHAYQLPDTGQNKCYDNTQEIPCPQPGQPFYGQDAQYHMPQPAYQDHGNGTVTDLNTGLMWQQGDGQNDQTRTWQRAMDYCADLGLGGHSDWRLPTRLELLSLVDYGIPYPGPTINTGYFPGCRSVYYWSSSTFAYYPASAWSVVFGDGDAHWDGKGTNYYYVRCVRGGP